jgi:hypothetical protein
MTRAPLKWNGFILALALLGVLACHDEVTAPDLTMDDFEGYLFLQPQLLILDVGHTGLFEATIRGHAPELESLLLELEWTSTNPDIVAVNGDGTVSGLAVGEAIIVARAPDGAEAKAHVIVRSADEPDGEGDDGGEGEKWKEIEPHH